MILNENAKMRFILKYKSLPAEQRNNGTIAFFKEILRMKKIRGASKRGPQRVLAKPRTAPAQKLKAETIATTMIIKVDILFLGTSSPDPGSLKFTSKNSIY